MDFLETFVNGGVSIDIYNEGRKEFYTTTEQLSKALGYKTVRGVYQLIIRNPKLKKNKFSRLVEINELPKFVGTQFEDPQKIRKVRIFSKRGVIELARYSKTDRAELFFDKLLDRLEWLEEQNRKAMLQHKASIPTQNQLHQAIQESPVYSEFEGQRLRNQFTNFNKLLSKIACDGQNKAKESMTAEQLKRLEHCEHLAIFLLGNGKDYQYIKGQLMDYVTPKGA